MPHCARARSSPSSETSSLACPLILAQPLSRRGLIPGMVEQIVGDLEGQADVAGIATIGRACLGGRRPMMQAASTANSIRAPVFNC